MNIGIIPARLDSKRFPKKILEPLNGKPMVANTVERSLMAKKLDRVILAIDSEETKYALKGYGFEISMATGIVATILAYGIGIWAAQSIGNLS